MEENQKISQEQLAAVVNDYLLVFTLTAADPKALSELATAFSRAQFAPVRPQTDASTKCQGMRYRTTIQVHSKSSSGTGSLLKTAGIILMVFGGLTLLKNIFG